MKKVLLTGEVNDIMRNIHECLISKFQVQLCANDIDNIQRISKIFGPDLIIVGHFGVEKIDSRIFEWAQKNCSNIPVLIIATLEDCGIYVKYCQDKQMDILVRPTTNVELLDKCYRMLHMSDMLQINEVEGEKKKILVVDDSTILLRNIKTLLEDKYQIFLASSGEQALKFIPQKKPDLVLLDYEMPGMSGKETFEAMKKDEYAHNIPVIFLTSIAQKEQIYAVLKSYPADYVLKPPVKEDLMNRIETVLKVRKLED